MPSKPISVFVLLGRTGSGKSTIARAIKEKLGLPSISFGEMARAEIKAETALGKILQPVLQKAEPIPFEIAFDMIEKTLASKPERFRNGFVLDNFPLSMVFVARLEAELKKRGMKVAAAYHIDAPKSLTRARRAREPRGKLGAEAEAREKAFREETVRVLLYYRGKRLLRQLDSTRAVRKNAARVGNALKREKRLKKRPK